MSGGGGSSSSGGRDPRFRDKLIKETGKNPSNAHAHHMFPQQFAKDFSKAGININNPKFGAWWESASHLKNAAQFNSEWGQFLRSSPNTEQIYEFGREMSQKYGLETMF